MDVITSSCPPMDLVMQWIDMLWMEHLHEVKKEPTTQRDNIPRGLFSSPQHFRLVEPLHHRQRKSYRGESRFLLPRPILLLSHCTVTVKLVDEDGILLDEESQSSLMGPQGTQTSMILPHFRTPAMSLKVGRQLEPIRAALCFFIDYHTKEGELGRAVVLSDVVHFIRDRRSPTRVCQVANPQSWSVVCAAVVATLCLRKMDDAFGLENSDHKLKEIQSSMSDHQFKTKLYIDGKWVEPVNGGKSIPVINPSNEQVIIHVMGGTEEDVNRAVAAARKAFEVQSGPNAWSTLDGKDRAKFLRAISKGVADKKELLARLEATDCGKPHREAELDLDDVAGCFDYYAGLAEKIDERQDNGIKIADDRFKSTVQYAPVGVVGAIIPWNYPLLMAAWKIAPALAAGCTVVLKPSEVTPITALEFAQIVHDAGVPPGVFNVVNGYGADVGGPLSRHPEVDKVAFTGSVATGSTVMREASATIKNVTLELGGKSPIVVFNDADITDAVEWIMFGIFWTNGQICSATSRLLVQEEIADRLLERLVEETKKIHVGDPFSKEDPSIGPLVNEIQHKKVLKYIDTAKKEGGKILTGGKRPNHLTSGYFIEPTVIVDVKENHTVWREEIFGPVLSVMRFRTEEEAIRLANDSSFGLAASILSKDEERNKRFVKAFRAGIVWVNCSQPAFYQCPWGGMKQSGIGRELGTYGLDNYLEVKQVTTYQVKESGKWGWYIKSKIMVCRRSKGTRRLGAQHTKQQANSSFTHTTSMRSMAIPSPGRAAAFLLLMMLWVTDCLQLQ
ncbi:hypothetical protein PROFUN_13949 [Planoprotostelium fungivorum]|uniref:Aldehyde dehydrogenase domain-containing protein n=1 Tax=Planoprotostelium fungivorum TaxID=1890364 RepID=A0A2P6N2G9_9EUKA|nr:hypothetical protein PROFUN_13949 [Planoprotostelium fungivorum]